ncbi:MAG: alpha/beta hydrolase [Acidimicrobiia bacterium]
MPHISLHRVELETLESGPADAPLALFLHGFPDNARTFDGLRAELASEGYRTVAPWLPGYFPSGLAHDGNYQVGAVASDVIELVERLAGDRSDTVLIGHDWGAIVGHAVAANAPDRLRALVAMSVPHQASLIDSFINSPDQLQRSWYIFVFQSLLAETAVAANDFAFIAKLWREWSPGSAAPESHVQEIKDAFSRPGCLSAALAYYRYMLGANPPDAKYAAFDAAAFGEINVPTMYMHGTDDGCMTLDLVNDATLTPLFPAGLRIERVEGAGHFLQLDAPDAVNALVVDFLGPAPATNLEG